MLTSLVSGSMLTSLLSGLSYFTIIDTSLQVGSVSCANPDKTSWLWNYSALQMGHKQLPEAAPDANQAVSSLYFVSKQLFTLQVRKLQEEHDWLQEQIEPGSVERQRTEPDVPMLLPSRPPVRHLSL